MDFILQWAQCVREMFIAKIKNKIIMFDVLHFKKLRKKNRSELLVYNHRVKKNNSQINNKIKKESLVNIC